jgi:TctA family transporter
MANTTFNGPVRSENGFQTISINQSTGTVTVTGTFGAATSVASLSATGNITADSNLAPAAGGMAAFLASSTAGLGVYVGSGVPTISAAQGSLYLRTDGSSTSTRAYINTNGTTGWTALTTAS